MNICIINDTRKCHSGSAKVMDNIYHLLSGHNIINEYIALKADYDLMIINGEGTMHDNATRAREILYKAKAAKEKNKKVALINTVWQNMSEHFNEIIGNIDVVIARDLYSYNILRRLNSKTAIFPDLSLLFHDKGKSGYNLNGIAKPITHRDAPYKTIFNEFHVPYYSIKSGIKYENQIADISKLDLYLTGQHHGVYAALLADTPFIPTYGNTHKIEGLIAWADAKIPVCKSPQEVRKAMDDIDRLIIEEKKVKEFLLGQTDKYETYLRQSMELGEN
jgi:hypothetical protein